MKLSSALLLGASVSGALLFAACATTDVETDDEGNDTPVLDSGPSVPKKDASGPAKPNKDASAPKKDSASEEPVQDAAGDAQPVGDGGPTLIEPAPGTACSVVGEAFSRSCGACGNQLAYCSPSHVVTGYGACRDQAEGACTPGATENGACGACGTTTRTCTEQCVFAGGVCQGETPGGCEPGRTEVRTTSCPTGQSIVYECSESCAFAVQSGAICTGTAAFPVITISPAEAGVVDRPVTAAEQVKGQRNLFYSCAGLSVQIVYGRMFELSNPTAQTATVDVWNTVANSQWDFVMLAYDQPPLAPADLIPACTAVNDICTTAPYSATANVCFAGAQALQIPPMARRWVYVGNFSSSDAARDYTLHVTTSHLQ